MRQHAIASWGLGPSLATSVLVHASVLAVGFLGLRFAHQVVAFPLEAVEIAVGDFQLQQGAAHSAPSRPSVVKVQPSPVDLAVQDQEKSKPEPVASEDAPVAVRVGEGGESSASQGATASAWDVYRVRVRQRIHEALLYPRTSKNLGETGQVKVKLTVQRDGTISGIQIAEPSAFDRLNTAAVDTIKRVAKLEPFPESYPGAQWDALVPIDFALR